MGGIVKDGEEGGGGIYRGRIVQTSGVVIEKEKQRSGKVYPPLSRKNSTETDEIFNKTLENKN